jgi:cellulose synthase/poly-beta-1,6-N-acetylglucosamine synthase-like glycosyltransferase
MEALKITLGSLYVLVTGLLILNGIHRYLTIYRYIQARKKASPNFNPAPPANYPPVTIQLPIYNEQYVAERVLEAVCKFDYPRHLLQIQVLDDSTDETAVIIKKRAEELRAKGLNVQYLYRHDRSGFKAGALENGLKQASGEFVAVFDADFIPPPDFLLKTIPYFNGSNIGMVQTCWGHINRGYSLLTKMLAILLDSHFEVEHIARNRNGLFFNFNGTAGIWRKSCIQDAGGWQHDTLTEDLDLSFRAQLKGWQFIYLAEVVCPAELPPEINAVKTQQFRWAKGSIQTARKLLPLIWQSKIPLRQKIESSFHLTSYMPTLWALYSSLFILPALFLWGYRQTLPIILSNLILFVITTVTFFMFFELTQRKTEKSLFRRIANSFLLMTIWMGLSISNGRALFEGLFNVQSDFKRTPKFKIEVKQDSWEGKKYIQSRDFTMLAEFIMVVYLAFTFWFILRHRDYFLMPFVFAFICGFGYVALLSLRTHLRSVLKDRS